MRHRQLLLAFSVLLIVAASLAARRSNDPKYQKTTVVRGLLRDIACPLPHHVNS